MEQNEREERIASAMKKVREITGAEVPAGLAGIFSKPVIHKDVIDIPDMKDYVIEKCTK